MQNSSAFQYIRNVCCVYTIKGTKVLVILVQTGIAIEKHFISHRSQEFGNS